MEFAEATPIDMIAPITDGTLNVVPVTNSNSKMPTPSTRQREDDGERIEKALIIDDHQHVDEDGREHQPETKIAECRLHALDLTANDNMIAGLELRLELIDDLLNRYGRSCPDPGFGRCHRRHRPAECWTG